MDEIKVSRALDRSDTLDGPRILVHPVRCVQGFSYLSSSCGAPAGGVWTPC